VGTGGRNNEEGPLPSENSRGRGAHHKSARRKRARRCVRRVVKQLVGRTHPAVDSPGFGQACRLFRDEMAAMGYDSATSDGILRALIETNEGIRDNEGQDGGDNDG
ncbi:unnamed protein product, partial [Sphacelaria rigidula]